MKQYYVIKHGFSNAYSLRYAECEEDMNALPKNAERITRREAEQFCADENDRRRMNPSNGGYADNLIYPAAGDFDEYRGFPPKSVGYIVQRCKYGKQ